MNILRMITKGVFIFLCFFVVIMAFLWSMKTGYDNIPAVRGAIDVVGNILIHGI